MRGMRDFAGSFFDKIDVTPVVAAHYRTLRDNRSGRAAPSDFVLMLGVPAAAGTIVGVLGVEMHGIIVVASAVSIFAALMFGLLVAALNMALGASGKARVEGASEATRRRAWVVEEFGANVAYSVLIAIVTAGVVLVVAVTVEPTPEGAQVAPPAPSGVVIALLVHLVLTLLMIVKRVVMVIRSEIVVARTGSEVKGPT